MSSRPTWRRALARVERYLLRNPYVYFTRVARQESVHLLHAHFGNIGVRYLPLKRLLRLPMFVTFYGYDLSKLGRNPEWTTAYDELFREADLFLVEGPYMCRQLLALGCPPEKAIVQRIGVDLGRFPFRPRHWSAGEEIHILLAGSFVEKKGIPYALRAFAQVARAHKNVYLRILGDGELRPEIETLIAELGLQERVTLLGYQPPEVFREECYRAHIFLLPSITASDGDTEGGSPVAITEAQATGLPVVSTWHCDIPEVVLDGQSGLLVPERDVDALATALEWLIEHPRDWSSMGAAGRRNVEKRFDLRQQAIRLEQLYADFLIAGSLPQEYAF